MVERDETPETTADEHYFDPSNLEEQWHDYAHLFEKLLEEGREGELSETASDLAPGDLSEIVKPLSVDDTARVIQLLPLDLAADVLSEIDKRSVDALMQLMDIEAIADIVEDMPSDEATDLIGDLEEYQAEKLLAAIEAEDRDEITELLQYSRDTAGGLMAKEFIAVAEDETCLHAVKTVRGLDEDDREDLHFIFVVDRDQRPVGRIPLVELLMQPWSTPVRDVMEPDPQYVSVGLDQEQVAQYVRTHDLVTLPVVDDEERLVGVISADDVLDVMEDEATEDYSMLAGTSSEEFGETSPLIIARARLPWLMGALIGQVACVLMMQHFEAEIATTVALTFFIPAIMAMGGNTGIQTSSVVVRGLATGEVDRFHITRYVGRELVTAVMTGGLISVVLFAIAGLVVGNLDLALVLTLSMFAVILCAALVGTSIPLMLHKFGIDPAIATGPFITTSNDMLAILIYLSMASLMLP